MTYEEIVRRANTKSSICPECGCFISSLLDCCPACGRRPEDKSDLRVRDSLVDSYRSLGGNGVTENPEYDNGIPSIRVVNSIADVVIRDGYVGELIYALDVGQTYMYTSLHKWEMVSNSSYVAKARTERAKERREEITDVLGNSYGIHYELAEMTGLSDSTISKYINGVQISNADKIEYYQTKSEALKAQQHTIQLYQEVINAMKSYSGRTVYE